MSTIAEIEEAIAKLPATEVRLLLQRLQGREAAAWDQQIAGDAQSGRLDALYTRLTERDGGQPQMSLDEVLDDPKFS